MPNATFMSVKAVTISSVEYDDEPLIPTAYLRVYLTSTQSVIVDALIDEGFDYSILLTTIGATLGNQPCNQLMQS